MPLLNTGYMETRRIGLEAMTSINFSRKNGQWIKTKNSKNQDTLIAPEDDRVLNDVYTPDQLPDFRLRAHPPPSRRHSIPQPPADSDSEEREMDADIPFTLMPPPAPAQPSAPEPSAVPEQPSIFEPPPALEQPPASIQPPASVALQQLVDHVRRISKRQQLILDHLDTFSRDHQQLELIAGQRTLLRYFGYDPGSTSSPPL